MNRLLPATAALTIAAALAWPPTIAQQNTPDHPKTPILALTPDKIQWFTPSYYTDGR